MAAEVPQWFQTQYNNRVIELYQRKGNRLRPTVMPAMRITDSEKAVFMKASGKGKARKKVRGQRATPMNIGRTKIEAPLVTWEAFDTVEEYDVDRMGVNEREFIANEGSNALGRATDDEIIDIIDAGAPTSGARFVDASSGAFTLVHAMGVIDALQSARVPWDGQVFCPLPTRAWNQFLSYKQVNSSDHVGQDLPFVRATDTRFWGGVNWFLYQSDPDDADDPLPSPSSNKLDTFAWHRTAVGWGNHTDLRSIWDWDNYESWWTINMQAKGVAVGLRPESYVRLRVSTNSAITVN